MPESDAPPLSCEQRSDDDCGCLEWDVLETMSARAKLVKDGDASVVQQQTPLPTGVEGGFGLCLGLLLGLLWTLFR